MNESDRAWLILANAYVRTHEFQLLKNRFGSAVEIARQPAATLRECGLAEDKAAAIAAPDERQVTRELEWLAAAGHHIVTWQSSLYPELLSQIPGPPLLLYVHGSPDYLHLPALAVVGSRNPTQGGLANAFSFSEHLARMGFCIVSGLAEGIDAAAHRGALAGNQVSIAFLGHGIDRVYPAMNRDLAHELADRGALVSEYPLGTHPERRHFPERNRLICGMSLGTLVIEAARRSGSLITARLASEQGREVFALPGSIHNPLARGCHKLIREGAKLVETADDIMNELAPLTGHVLQSSLEPKPQEPHERSPDPEYVELKQHLGHDPLTAGELAARSGLTIDRVSSMLLILELRGEVESLSGGRYSLLI
jgi:DNA processing protein